MRELAAEEGDTGRQKTKKRKGAPPSEITAYFGNAKPYAKMMCSSSDFWRT